MPIIPEASARSNRDRGCWRSYEEFDERISRAPEKIEYVGGVFASERERRNVPEILPENLGIDAAIRALDCGAVPGVLPRRRSHRATEATAAARTGWVRSSCGCGRELRSQ